MHQRWDILKLFQKKMAVLNFHLEHIEIKQKVNRSVDY